jgi:hypothetical protein
MASEIRVDKINSLSGVGTVTLSPTGVDIAGITTAATLRATTGIVTSLTAGSLTSLGAVSGTTGTFSSSVSGTRGTFSEEVDIADKIIHTGDTDTAIRFPAADTITAETGGSERLRIDSNGNIGVNVTPTNYSNYVTLGLNDSTGSTIEGRVGGTLTGSFTVDSLVTVNAVTSIPIVFKTANTERIRIEPTGNLKVNNNLSVTGIATVGSAVTISESGVEASGIGVTCANINGGHIGGRRNMIINGDMTVAQRGSTIAASSYTTAGYGLDRWRQRAIATDEADFVVTQESDVPTGSGFSRSLKIKTNTVENSLDSGEIFHVAQFIEAQNLQHLKNGTSSALPVTLSFWVKSYQTGTYVVNVYKSDNTSRHITATYTISASNTWEFKTMTFPGDTSGGGIDSDTGAGLQIYWVLASGSGFTGDTSTSWTNYTNGGFANGQTVNIFSSTNNYYYLTGVQLEIGTQATPFEHISFAENKRLCMRYFERIDNGSASGATYHYFGPGYFEADNNLRGLIDYKEQKRATPTVTFSDGSTFNAINTGSMPSGTAISAQYINTINTGYTLTAGSVSGRDGQGGLLVANNTANAYVLVDAEL